MSSEDSHDRVLTQRSAAMSWSKLQVLLHVASDSPLQGCRKCTTWLGQDPATTLLANILQRTLFDNVHEARDASAGFPLSRTHLACNHRVQLEHCHVGLYSTKLFGKGLAMEVVLET